MAKSSFTRFLKSRTSSQRRTRRTGSSSINLLFISTMRPAIFALTAPAHGGSQRPRSLYARCIKTVMTERDAFLAYSTKYGAELETSLAQSDRASVEASLERTITEAIMANPKTEYCRDFTFIWPEPDSCDCEFVVKGRGYDEIQTVSLNFSK